MITDLKAGTMQSIEPWAGTDRIYREDKQIRLHICLFLCQKYGFDLYNSSQTQQIWAIGQKVLMKIAIHIDNSMSVAI